MTNAIVGEREPSRTGGQAGNPLANARLVYASFADTTRGAAGRRSSRRARKSSACSGRTRERLMPLNPTCWEHFFPTIITFHLDQEQRNASAHRIQ